MAIPVLFDHGTENASDQNRSREPLVDDRRHFGGVMTERSRAQRGEADLLKRNFGEIKHLRSARLMLPIDAILEVLARRGGDAIFCLSQEVRPFAEDHCARGTYRGAGRLLVMVQAVVAEFTFDYFRIP